MIGEKVQHYEVTEKLGAGGMGEVYLATDTKLGRQVALKFLPREFATDPERRQRLELEATSASSLDHPNILTIHEIGEHDGQPYIAMSYVQGGTLEEKLKEQRPGTTEAMQYALQLAGALGAAHARGIVHRDVKPANLLIGGEDNRLRLTDFGLAKLKESSGLTSAGTTVGTVGYMSPEQVQGQPVDSRSDVFSLGVILYELFTGKKPFHAEHAAAALYSIVHETPPAPRSVNSDIPPELSRLIERAMAKDPRDRFDDGRAVEAELEAVAQAMEIARLSSGRMATMRFRRRGRLAWALGGAMAVAFGLLMVALPFFQTPNGGGGEAQADTETLAIMQFENLSDSEDPERFGDIITELLTTDLSGSNFVTVVSSQRLHDLFEQEGEGHERAPERSLALRVAKKAKADRMLTGSLSSLRERKIVTAQLIDVSSGDVVGSERVDGSDLFAMVDDLAVRIKKRIGLTESEILAGDIPVSEATTNSPDAYREYLLGMEKYHGLYWDEARKHFNRAIELDSTFALAYFRLGISYFSDGQEEAGFAHMKRAAENIDRTVGCDKLLLQAMAIDFGQNLDLMAARETLKKAIREYPTHKEPYMWLGNFEQNQAERDTSYYYLQKALELDPNYPFALLIYGGRLVEDKRYDEGRPVVERYMRVRPDDVLPYMQLGNMFVDLGYRDSAAIWFRKCIEVAPEQRYGYQGLGQIYVLDGKLDSALYWYGKLHYSGNVYNRILGHRNTAAAYMVQGHFDKAEEHYEIARALSDSAGMVNQSAATERSLGWLHFNTDRLDDAMRHFRLSDQLDSLDFGGLYGIARVYATMGQSGRALQLVDSVHAVWGGRVMTESVAQSNRAMFAGYGALSEGRYQDAIASFKECRRISGDSTSCQAAIGEAYLRSGQIDAAVGEFTAYQEAAESDWYSGTYLKSLYLLADAYVQSDRKRDAVAPLERLMLFWGEADWDVPWMRDAKRLYGSLTAQ